MDGVWLIWCSAVQCGLIWSDLFVADLICGHVRRSPMGGGGSSASVKVISGRASPSTAALAVTSASLLYYMSVCDLTLPMCVRSCFESLILNSWLVRWSTSLCRWWL